VEGVRSWVIDLRQFDGTRAWRVWLARSASVTFRAKSARLCLISKRT
jgi:hypothetical protein